MPLAPATHLRCSRISEHRGQTLRPPPRGTAGRVVVQGGARGLSAPSVHDIDQLEDTPRIAAERGDDARAAFGRRLAQWAAIAALIGDHFAHGWYVPKLQTLPSGSRAVNSREP